MSSVPAALVAPGWSSETWNVSHPKMAARQWGKMDVEFAGFGSSLSSNNLFLLIVFSGFSVRVLGVAD